jgi:hypothetical protein
MNDPELDGDLSIDEEGTVTGQVRIVRVCAECGTELKEATLDLEQSVDIPDTHVNKEGEDLHTLEVEEDGCEGIEEGGGRYAKSYYGAEVGFVVRCSCDEAKPLTDRWSVTGSMSDKVAASHMDEMV